MRTVTLHQASDVLAADPDQADRLLALERVELFNPFERHERELLARGMRRLRFAAGESIIKQGEAGDSLYLIAEGDVLVSLGARGVDQSVTTLRPGDFFGEMSLMTGEPRTANCSARTDVICYLLDHATFQQIVTMRPEIADQMSALLARRQAHLDRKGGELTVRAAQHSSEMRSKLLARIKKFFELD